MRAGPFAGFAYPDWGLAQVDLFAPKLIGSFERELHAAVEQAIGERPAIVVNVGAAEGYYAVGLALRLPGARVVAFEADDRHHAALVAIAELNGVHDRIELRGACSTDSLQEALFARSLVVCDCDGCELPLLDPELVPDLQSSTIIVEAHDLLVAGVTPTLHERFEPTHDIEDVPTQPRYVDDFPELGDIPLVTRQLSISEFRGAPMGWLVMRPR